MAPSAPTYLLALCQLLACAAGEEMCRLQSSAVQAHSLLQAQTTQRVAPALDGPREATSNGAAARVAPIPADDIVVGMAVTGKEPYRSRAETSKATWGRYFDVVDGFTFDEVPHAPWVRHVDKAFPEEGTARAHGLTLAMIPIMLSLYPQAKWYFFCDDDTFVVPHQLRQVAMSMNASEANLAGRCFRYDPDGHVTFICGGSGILASRALLERVAPHVLDCRKKYNWHDYSDTRVASCARDAFGGLETYIACRRSEFYNAPLEEAGPANEIYPDTKAVAMHLKDPDFVKTLFGSLEGEISVGRDIFWKDVARLVPDFGKNAQNAP